MPHSHTDTLVHTHSSRHVHRSLLSHVLRTEHQWQQWQQQQHATFKYCSTCLAHGHGLLSSSVRMANVRLWIGIASELIGCTINMILPSNQLSGIFRSYSPGWWSVRRTYALCVSVYVRHFNIKPNSVGDCMWKLLQTFERHVSRLVETIEWQKLLETVYHHEFASAVTCQFKWKAYTNKSVNSLTDKSHTTDRRLRGRHVRRSHWATTWNGRFRNWSKMENHKQTFCTENDLLSHDFHTNSLHASLVCNWSASRSEFYRPINENGAFHLHRPRPRPPVSKSNSFSSIFMQ